MTAADIVSILHNQYENWNRQFVIPGGAPLRAPGLVGFRPDPVRRGVIIGVKQSQFPPVFGLKTRI